MCGLVVPMVHGWKATGRPFWHFLGRPGKPTAQGSMIPEATSPVARGLTGRVQPGAVSAGAIAVMPVSNDCCFVEVRS